MRPGTFEPSRHGFPFSARFTYPGSLLGLTAPLSPDFGLGGGMCWAALDRYLADRQLPASLNRPGAGEPLYMELVQRQANTLANGGWAKVTEWQRRPDGGVRLRKPGVAELTRREWRRVKRRLDRGLPVLLFVIRERGPFANPSENRQVLAYRYQVDGGSRLTLWVYDPLRPGSDDVRLALNLSRRMPLDATFAGRETIRGFFAIAYDRQAPQQLHVHVPIDPRLGAPELEPEPPAAMPAVRGGLHAFARDQAGNLLHFRRTRAGRWRAMKVTSRRTAEFRLSTPPVPLPERYGRVFALDAKGGLVEYRKRRWLGWAARSITARRNIGDHFRIEEQPAALAGAGGTVDVFGVGNGRLLHYQRSRAGRWSAENLTGRLGTMDTSRIAGRPVACMGEDRSENVLVRNSHGDLLSFRRSRRGAWHAENATLRVGGWDAFRIASDPVPVPVADALHVFGLTASGEPVQYRRGDNGRWRARKLTGEVTGEDEPHRIRGGLSALEGPGGTLHLFGLGTEAGLVHYWWLRGEWHAEDLTVGRATIGDDLRLDGAPSVARGPGETLHVLARRGEEVLLYRWSRDSDWVAENLTRDRWSGSAGRVCTDPQALVDAHDRLHVLTLDPESRLQHAGRRSTSHATWQIGMIRVIGAVADALRPIPDALVAAGVAITQRLRPRRRQSPLLRVASEPPPSPHRRSTPPREESVWAQAQTTRRVEAERQAEEERRIDTARRAEEAMRLEMERKAEQERRAELEQQEQAARVAEAEQRAAAARKAEQERRAEAAWQAELAKQAKLDAEAARQAETDAETERRAETKTAAARRAELEAEAARQAALEAEAARQAKLEAEAARRAELEAEAARRAEREAAAARRAELEAEAVRQAELEAARLAAKAQEESPIDLPEPVLRRKRRPVDPELPPFVPPAASPAWLEELFPDRTRPAPGAEAERDRRRRQLLALENILRLAEQYSGDATAPSGSTKER